MLGGTEKHSEECSFSNHHRCNYVIAAFTAGNEVRTVVCECWCHTITAADIAAIRAEMFEELRKRAQVELARGRR